MSQQSRSLFRVAALAAVALALLVAGFAAGDPKGRLAQLILDRETDAHATATVQRGREIFRDETFGDEGFWGGTIRLHQAIAGAAHGGVGPGVSPKTALAVGLKVDANAIPAAVAQKIQRGEVDLDDPATTLALLQLDAVIGVKGRFDSSGQLASVGITCALCHSTVDDSFAPGIGNRRDGWANRDLNVGAIIALAPDLSSVASLLGTTSRLCERC